jgi:hypothetical protein
MTPQDPAIFGIPIDFILFGLALPGVAVFHRHTMRVALAGLITVMFYKILLLSPHIAGALIGGGLAHQLFREEVCNGYVAMILATSNAGGAWSVLGDRK